MTVQVTLDTAVTIEKIKYHIDWLSNCGWGTRTVSFSVQQAGVWTSVASSTNTSYSTTGSWANVSAVKLYIYGVSAWDDDPSVAVTCYELEAWGSANAVTLTASDDVFSTDHIGALFKLTQPRETSYVTSSLTAADTHTQPIDIEGNFTFKTSGTWDMVVELQRNVNDEGWEVYRTFVSTSNARINVLQSYEEDEDNVQYRVYVKTFNSGTVNATITSNSPTQSGIARVTGFTSATVVTADVLVPFASVDATERWYEGAWSSNEGWPSAFTFFEERAVYAGTTGQPQSIWLSASGEYENFDEGTNDDDAFWVTLGSDRRNKIRWLASLEALCIGTSGGEWRMRATSLDEQLTPTNFNLRLQTTYGSKKVQPVTAGAAILFVDYVGRKVRELTFVADKDKFVAPDLTALAEDITIGGITSIALQKNPDLILWCTLATGELLSMVYERDQNVVAWAEHPLGGTSASADSVSVIPGTDEDEIWLCVSRTVRGSTVRHIEQMQPRVEVDLEDAWFVDDGLSWDGGDEQTITGATNADPCVVTVASHGYSDGDHIYISGVGGMTELNGNYYTIDNSTTNTVELRDYEKHT
jgi:hypothetical protein